MNILLEPFATSAWASSLGWTLLHSLWQGLLISGILAGILSVSRSQAPQFRYALGVSALLVMLLTSIWTFSSIHTATPGSSETLSIAPLAETSATNSWLASPLSFPPQAITTASDSAISEQLSSALPWLSIFWMLGVCLFGLRVIGGWWYLHQIRRQSKVDLPTVWYQTATRLAREMGLHRIPEISGSLRMASPLVFGVLKPIILIPVSLTTGLSSSQIASILAHELAHIQRQDYLINLLQSLVEALFFFHPAIWWISQKVREERELCCDDVAIAVAGDAIGYARALAELESRRLVRPHLAMPLEGTGSLMYRIRRLVEVEPQREPGSGHLFLALLLTVAMGMSLWFSSQPQGNSNEFFTLQTFPEQVIQVQSLDEVVSAVQSVIPVKAEAVMPVASIRMDNGEQRPMLAAIGAISPMPAYWSSLALVDTPPPPPIPSAVAVPAVPPVMPAMPAMPEMPEMPNFQFHFDDMDSSSMKSMEQFGAKWGEEMQAWGKEMEQWGKEFGKLQGAHFQEHRQTSEAWQLEAERMAREGARHAAEAQREIERTMRTQHETMRKAQEEIRAQEREMRQQEADMRVQERDMLRQEIEMKTQMRQEEERMRMEETRMKAEMEGMREKIEQMKKTLIPALLNDGLIKNKKDRITIKLREGVWRINGTKLTPAQARSYQEILQSGGIDLKEDGTVNIQGD